MLSRLSQKSERSKQSKTQECSQLANYLVPGTLRSLKKFYRFSWDKNKILHLFTSRKAPKTGFVAAFEIKKSIPPFSLRAYSESSQGKWRLKFVYVQTIQKTTRWRHSKGNAHIQSTSCDLHLWKHDKLSRLHQALRL